MQFFHGTPSLPMQDCNGELRHNCRHCTSLPPFFHAEGEHGEDGAESGDDSHYNNSNNPFFRQARELMDLPDAGHDMDCESVGTGYGSHDHMIDIDGDMDVDCGDL